MHIHFSSKLLSEVLFFFSCSFLFLFSRSCSFFATFVKLIFWSSERTFMYLSHLDMLRQKVMDIIQACASCLTVVMAPVKASAILVVVGV